jgi:hypothetical protein
MNEALLVFLLFFAVLAILLFYQNSLLKSEIETRVQAHFCGHCGGPL